jgi:endoglucanase
MRPFTGFRTRITLLAASAAFAGLLFQSCSVKMPEQRKPKMETAPEEFPETAPEPEQAAAPKPFVAPEIELPPPKASPVLRAEGTRIVDAQGRQVFLKGCNFGNWLLLEMWMLRIDGVRDQYDFESILTQRFGEAEKNRLMELYRTNFITERDFAMVRRFGMNVVRIPFNYTLLEDDAHPFQLKDGGFEWLDMALELAQKHKLYVILDMHGVQGGQSVDHTTGRAGQNKLWSDETCQKRLAWLWKSVAERYKDNATIAMYDLINEPFGDYSTNKHLTKLVAVCDQVYKAVRSVDTNHIIIIPGARQGIEFYGDPKDHGWENIAFTEHYYPGLFGEDPSPETHAEFIYRTLPVRKAYLDKVQVPFLVGEFNTVFAAIGGGALMRKYYDEYAARGWAATMWSYKLVDKEGGLDEDTWCMVKNHDPEPPFDLKTSPLPEIESWMKWLGSMNYAIYENLGAALTAKVPPAVFLPQHDVLPVEPPAVDPLKGWKATDVNGAKAGGQKVISDSAMDIYGAGEDIWSKADQFRFVWKETIGDFELTATLKTLANSHNYAKAGLMLRSSLEPDASLFLINAFPDGSILLAWRSFDGSAMEQKVMGQVSLPVQLRMRRKGSFLEVGFSTDGTNWTKTKVHTTAKLGLNGYAGLAVLSHDNRFLTVASFENIRFEAR